MERNNGRYNNSYLRRQGQQQNQSHNHYSTSSSSSSLSSNSNNNHNNYDNHRQNSSSSSTTTSTTSASSSSSSTTTQFSTNNASYSSQFMTQREPQTQHDELIRYITEAWTKINEQGTQVYHCNESEQQLKNFKPFNLGEFWGQRLVQKIRISSGNQ